MNTNNKSKNNKFQAAIIGLGYQSHEDHIPGIKNIPLLLYLQ